LASPLACIIVLSPMSTPLRTPPTATLFPHFLFLPSSRSPRDTIPPAADTFLCEQKVVPPPFRNTVRASKSQFFFFSKIANLFADRWVPPRGFFSFSPRFPSHSTVPPSLGPIIPQALLCEFCFLPPLLGNNLVLRSATTSSPFQWIYTMVLLLLDSDVPLFFSPPLSLPFFCWVPVEGILYTPVYPKTPHREEYIVTHLSNIRFLLPVRLDVLVGETTAPPLPSLDRVIFPMIPWPVPLSLCISLCMGPPSKP